MYFLNTECTGLNMKTLPQVHVWMLSPKLATLRGSEKLQDTKPLFKKRVSTGTSLELYWVAEPLLALPTTWSYHHDSLPKYKEPGIHDPSPLEPIIQGQSFLPNGAYTKHLVTATQSDGHTKSVHPDPAGSLLVSPWILTASDRKGILGWRSGVLFVCLFCILFLSSWIWAKFIQFAPWR